MSHEARDLYAEQEQDLLRRAHRQEECGNYLIMRQALEGDDTSPKVHRASLCEHRITCPFCAAQLAARKAGHYAPRLAELRLADDRRRAYIFTLTVPNGPDLRETFGLLQGGLKKLHKRYDNARNRKNGSTFGSIVAQLGQFEIKRGRVSQLWHPHYHGILITEGRFDYTEFQQAWRDAIDHDKAWCKVLMTNTEKDLRANPAMTLDDMRSGFMRDLVEVIKYPHKIDTNRPQDAWFAASVLKGVHLTRAWGQVRHKSFEELTDEPLDWDQLAYIERMLCWEGDEYSMHAMPGTPQPYSEFDEFS